MSRIIDSFVGPFAAVATVNAAILAPCSCCSATTSPTCAPCSPSMASRLVRPAAGQGALRGDLAATDARMAQAPGADAGGGAGG